MPSKLPSETSLLEMLNNHGECSSAVGVTPNSSDEASGLIINLLGPAHISGQDSANLISGTSFLFLKHEYSNELLFYQPLSRQCKQFNILAEPVGNNGRFL